jgi:hypothetical protein
MNAVYLLEVCYHVVGLLIVVITVLRLFRLEDQMLEGRARLERLETRMEEDLWLEEDSEPRGGSGSRGDCGSRGDK